MKQDFHNPDKLEIFRTALNCEAKLFCGVDEAYDLEKAADFLQRLCKSWRMSENDVIASTMQRVGNTIDKRLRMHVLQFLDAMKIPHSPEKIKEQWKTLSIEEKKTVVDSIFNYLKECDSNDLMICGPASEVRGRKDFING